jgi:uncharacterized protein YndB with AHSA1/START domain
MPLKSQLRVAGDRPAHRAPAPCATIRVDARYCAPPERVFNAWLDPDLARQWLFATATRPLVHVEIDARVGGSFRLVERHEPRGFEHHGAYADIVAHRRLEFSLGLADRPRAVTRVTVEMEPRGADCALSLAHEHVPLDLVHCFETRWIGMLYGLGVTLESFEPEAQSKRRSIVTDIVVPRLVPLRAASRTEIQTSTHPRSH